MLKKIEIKGFRSFSQESFQEIDIYPFTVIVGENDTGKSNILKAIEFVLNPKTNNVVREDFNIRVSLARNGKLIDKKASKIFIKLYFNDQNKFLPIKFQRKNYHPQNNPIFTIQCTATGYNIKTYKKRYRLNGKLIPQKDVSLLLSKIKCYITPSIRDVNYLNDLKEILPIKKSSLITQEVKGILKVVSNKLKERERLVKNATGAERAIIKPILKTQDVLKAMDFDFSLIKDNIPIRLRYHGQGMISKIILSLFLKRGVNQLIGIEEPEIHMHPNLIREIILKCETLIKKGTQVIITTHSPNFTNIIKSENIILVKKDPKYTRVTKIYPEALDIAQKIKTNIFLNQQKSEMLFAKGVILVEGPYDRRIFTAIDEREQTLSFAYGVSIIDIGGDGNFSTYIELCNKAEIPWVAIGDKSALVRPGDNQKGPLLKAIEGYVSDSCIATLEQKIISERSTVKALKDINQILKKKNGYVTHIQGNDISDTVVDIFDKKNSQSLYRKIFLDLGGSQRETSPQSIKDIVESKIRRKKDEMVCAVYGLKKPHELERIFKHALNVLKKNKLNL